MISASYDQRRGYLLVDCFQYRKTPSDATRFAVRKARLRKLFGRRKQALTEKSDEKKQPRSARSSGLATERRPKKAAGARKPPLLSAKILLRNRQVEVTKENVG